MTDFHFKPENYPEADSFYAAPDSEFSDDLYSDNELDEIEQIRGEHFSAEASVRAIGTFFIIFGVIFMMLDIIVFILKIVLIIKNINDQEAFDSLSRLFYLFILGNILFKIGLGLRKLRNWARIISIIIWVPFSVFPFAWPALYSLFNKKAAYVCKPEYAQIREITPYFTTKKSIVYKILIFSLAAILFVLIESFISGFLNGMNRARQMN